MIDKFFFWFFGKIDDWSSWIEQQFTKVKKKKKKAINKGKVAK